MKREPLTYNDVFGPDGLVPLHKLSLKANCICPHCNHIIQGICFPPPGIISIHTCPICANSIIPFAGRLIPVDSEKIKSKKVREHIAKCIFVSLSAIFIGTVLDYGYKLTGRRAGQFLNDCYEVIFKIVGEHEDEATFMERLRKAFLDLKSDSNVRPEVVQSVYGFLANMTKAFNRGDRRPIISEKDVEGINEIDSVDDFLNKYFKDD